MSSLSEELRQEYTIETPESVSFGYDVAGIGSRLVGALIDLILVIVLLGLLNVALWMLLMAVGGADALFFGLDADANWVVGVIIALYSLFQFAIIWGYFLLFELLWNGQTPGKRAAKTRALRMDGEPAGFAEVAVRNLVRFIDFLPSFYAVGFVTMLFNEKARRLGDYAAGTIVVREQISVRLADVAGPARKPTATPVELVAADPNTPALDVNLRLMTHDDYALIRDALAREARGALDPTTLGRLAKVYAARLMADNAPSTAQEGRAWLTRVVAAWDAQASSGGGSSAPHPE